MDVYALIVLAHVVFVIVGFGAHGVSAFAIFRTKVETDRTRIAAILDLSASTFNIAGFGIIGAVILGIIAAAMRGHFSNLWPWVSIVLVVLIWISMTFMASRPMNRVREALGMPVQGDKKDAAPREPASDEVLAAAQARLRPEIVATIGVGGIVALTWMMEVKPF
jgi:MFS family permease